MELLDVDVGQGADSLKSVTAGIQVQGDLESLVLEGGASAFVIGPVSCTCTTCPRMHSQFATEQPPGLAS